jgi:hypothetical protein
VGDTDILGSIRRDDSRTGCCCCCTKGMVLDVMCASCIHRGELSSEYNADNLHPPSLVTQEPLMMQNARPPLPASCPVAISHLITQCWATNPDRRPQFDDIVAILESYKEAVDEDPSFFLSYVPPPIMQQHQHQQRLLRCFPRCITMRRSASLNV